MNAVFFFFDYMANQCYHICCSAYDTDFFTIVLFQLIVIYVAGKTNILNKII